MTNTVGLTADEANQSSRVIYIELGQVLPQSMVGVPIFGITRLFTFRVRSGDMMRVRAIIAMFPVYSMLGIQWGVTTINSRTNNVRERAAMRGRPLVIEWRETADELQQRFQSERNGHRRARLNAMLMLRKEQPISEVCQAVGVDYRTIQRWLSWYRQGGLESVLNRTPGHAAPGRPSHLGKPQIAQLLEKADTGDFRTIWDAVRWTQDKFGVEYTYTGMHALLNRNQRDRT